jgi:tRNA-splicing ligase RtcB
MSNNIFGKHDENTLEQFREVEKTATKAALMPDGHFGYIMPVGGVAGYRNLVSVHGVGYDIACGNAALKTDMKLSDLGKSPEKLNFMLTRIADEVFSSLSFGIGLNNKSIDSPRDHALFDSPRWKLIPRAYKNQLFDKAREQLGTIGSGNHYVDIFVDEEDYLWVGVHFGSRGFGHGVATAFLAIGQGGQWGDKKPEAPVFLNLLSAAGSDYWELMTLAGEYAYAGREWVARKVVDIIGAKEVELVHNHHNFAWKEKHAVGCTIGEDFLRVRLANYTIEELVVVRKGATPAFPYQKGFVGGSMGDNAVILEGRDCRLPTDSDFDGLDIEHFRQTDAMFSTVHGAGRVMSRTEAAGKRNRKTGELKLDKETGLPVKPPRVIQTEVDQWLRNVGVILRGGGLDEAPQAYRRLPEVLGYMEENVKILHTLKPLVVCMAGANEFDPYKD